MRGRYFQRAVALLGTWLSSESEKTGKDVWSILGSCDSDVKLVLTGSGPEYWAKGDARMGDTREVQGISYTQEFANAFTTALFSTGGIVAPAVRKLIDK